MRGCDMKRYQFQWLLIFFLWHLVSGGIFYDDSRESSAARKRRSALEFYGLIQCHQPGVIVLSTYGDYGCFCGVGGNGNRPLDATDRCCEIHDNCYRPLKDIYAKTYKEIGLMAMCGELCVPYTQKCENNTIVCDPDNSPFASAICECDKAASECFAAARPTYDTRLGNVDPNVWCTDNSSVTELLDQLNTKEKDFTNPSTTQYLPRNATTETATTTYQAEEDMYNTDYNDDIIEHLPLYPVPENATEDSVLLARLRIYEMEITEKPPGGSTIRIICNMFMLFTCALCVTFIDLISTIS